MSSDDIRVSQGTFGQFAIHQFKDFASPQNEAALHWEGQSNVAPIQSPIVLQIYNQNSATWETVDVDSTSAADTDIVLSAFVSNLTNYKDGNNVVSCRVYQQGI